MKKFSNFLFLIIVITSPLTFQSFTRKKGDSDQIQFKKVTFLTAKNLAKKEGKIIFIDANTSWCGPCKKMAAISFKDSKVATVFNARFINLNIDIEKNLDGPEIEKTYKIEAYPTLLFINSKGKVIKKILGFQSDEELLSIAKSIK